MLHYSSPTNKTVTDTGFQLANNPGLSDLAFLARTTSGVSLSMISLFSSRRQVVSREPGLVYDVVPSCYHLMQQRDFSNSGNNDPTISKSGAKLTSSNDVVWFCTGVPIICQRKEIGGICLLHNKPFNLSPQQYKQLQRLGRLVVRMEQAEKRKEALRLLRQEEEQRKAANKILLENQRKILLVMGHDCRGPLSSMKHLLDLVQDGLCPPEEVPRLMSLMQDQLNFSLQTYDSLVTWGRLNMDIAWQKPICAWPTQIIRKELSLLAHTATSKLIDLHMAIQDSHPVAVTEGVLAFVVRNLMSNAIKFTSKGSITIEWTQQNAYCVLTVADTGVGMDQAGQKSLFRSHVASKDGTNSEKGCGIGLMLVHDFVQQLDGFIEVQSEPGAGTTFTVGFPVVAYTAPLLAGG
ncbi:Signal transduction histidine kinase [Cnuella takakiae]|uniref:histidine kinase n=1 Tax=Cnuella takakiae TaxID=1302690 RepID=A0A1M4SRX7_9BACT|nr:HAMP domain-containing sensor histidine kinase [Cnuella takakiae]SHE35004.1 Signal transduction histidine kinase [Cnuella takakiae]